VSGFFSICLFVHTLFPSQLKKGISIKFGLRILLLNVTGECNSCPHLPNTQLNLGCIQLERTEENKMAPHDVPFFILNIFYQLYIY
jgi:hypothetical protein